MVRYLYTIVILVLLNFPLLAQDPSTLEQEELEQEKKNFIIEEHAMTKSLPVTTLPPGKDPFNAAMRSLIMPGLGQFYKGDNRKGVIFLCAELIETIATLFFLWNVNQGGQQDDTYLVFAGISAASLVITHIINVSDAHNSSVGKTKTE